MLPISSLSFVNSWLELEVTHLTSLFCVTTENVITVSFPRELLLHIGHKILKNVVNIYKNVLQFLEPTSSQQLQNCALQLLFDMKFLSNLLPHTSPLTTKEV